LYLPEDVFIACGAYELTLSILPGRKTELKRDVSGGCGASPVVCGIFRKSYQLINPQRGGTQ